MKELKILAPCGILGYGFPETSFQAGMEMKPDAIVVDAGSTDAGPHKLGAGVAIVSRKACKKDLEIMIAGGANAGIPVIIGSAGGAGGRVHVEWTLSIIDEILREHNLTSLKIAVIWADIEKALVADRLADGQVDPLGLTVPELTPERLARTTGIVAQMGHEPVVRALEAGADIIVCGRAYDPSPFAAVAVFHGFALEYGYHAGKILECAALCAQPGTTKDCMLGVIQRDGFTITPLSENRVCTKTSVAAHTFYEKDHPYFLHGPGFTLDLQSCSFTELNDGRSVKVQNSRLIKSEVYRVKLEGALLSAYRTFVVAGIRDPLLISRLPEIEAQAEEQTRGYYNDIPSESYQIRFLNYGMNAVMGSREPNSVVPHEVGVVFEVLAESQDIADSVCATLRSTLLHYGYEGRKSTAGNLAFPFAPSDVSFGPVYEFSVYHLMDVKDGLELFSIEYRSGGAV
jgi:hypothetical protein